MKKGDLFRVKDRKDMKETLKNLEIAGFHAVAAGENWIRITGVPELQFLVQCADSSGRMQKAYCRTLEEAEDIAAEYGNSFDFVEIMKGYPGEWESVSRSW